MSDSRPVSGQEPVAATAAESTDATQLVGGAHRHAAQAIARFAEVKPPPFEYVAPSSLEEAVAALAEHGEDAKVLAGGQSLIPLLSLRLARPTALIDLNGVAELSSIAVNGEVSIGAMTRHRTVERSADIAKAQPLLAGTAAPSAAAWRTPIRPPSCRQSRWRSTPRSGR